MTVASEEITEPQAEESAAESEAPPAEGAATKEPKTPLTIQERVTKALNKGRTSERHQAFIKWISDNTDQELDVDTVVVTMAMYNEYRQLPEFKELVARLKAASPAKAMPEPKTPEEAAEQIKKLQAEAEKAAEADKRRQERLARAQAIMAAAAGEQPATTEATDSTTAPAEEAAASEPEEAF
jgi:hypothetical protein